MSPFRILATDLDGTFLPLPDEPDNKAALEHLAAAFAEGGGRTLIFATGRHLGSVLQAKRSIPLPTPHWIVSDVGVAVNEPVDSSKGFAQLPAYASHLRDICGGETPAELKSLFSHLEGLELQPAESQRTFKLSYTCPPDRLDQIEEEMDSIIADRELPVALTTSVDPDAATGLIDVLPEGVSKCSALLWLAEFAGLSHREMVYAGDSGNDRSALVSDLAGILVGNATPSLRRDVLAVREQRGDRDRLYLSKNPATSGVLEGCRHFGLVE